MIVQYAIIWYLTKETGSATILSIATILGMLPMALLSPFVGPLVVDRWNKKSAADRPRCGGCNACHHLISLRRRLSRFSNLADFCFITDEVDRTNLSNANHSISYPHHGSGQRADKD